MKKMLTIFLVLLLVSAVSVFAGGGKEKAQPESTETGTESEEVCRLGTKGADCAEERRDAASG